MKLLKLGFYETSSTEKLKTEVVTFDSSMSIREHADKICRAVCLQLGKTGADETIQKVQLHAFTQGLPKKLIRLLLSRKPDSLEEAIRLIEREIQIDETMKKFEQISINITEGEYNKDRGRKRVRILKETQLHGSRSFFSPDGRRQMAIGSDFVRKKKEETKGQI